jgi:Phosphodiester glycosidase
MSITNSVVAPLAGAAQPPAAQLFTTDWADKLARTGPAQDPSPLLTNKAAMSAGALAATAPKRWPTAGSTQLAQIPGVAPAPSYASTDQFIQGIRRGDPGAWELGVGVVKMWEWTDHGVGKQAMRAALKNLPVGTWMRSLPAFDLGNGQTLSVGVFKVDSSTVAITSGGKAMRYRLLPNGVLDAKQTAGKLYPVYADPNLPVNLGGQQGTAPSQPTPAPPPTQPATQTAPQAVDTPLPQQAALQAPPNSYSNAAQLVGAIQRGEPGAKALGVAMSSLYDWADHGQTRAAIRQDLLDLPVGGAGITRGVSDGTRTTWFTLHKVKPGYVTITANGSPNRTMTAQLNSNGSLDLADTNRRINQALRGTTTTPARTTQRTAQATPLDGMPIAPGPKDNEIGRAARVAPYRAIVASDNGKIESGNVQTAVQPGLLDGKPGLERLRFLSAPTYRPNGLQNTYISVVDPQTQGFSLLAKPSTEATAAAPNPSFENFTARDWLARANSGATATADGGRALAVGNAGFFDKYGAQTTSSFATLVNGQLLNTGKMEPGRKKVLAWNNDGSGFKVANWGLNTGPKVASGQRAPQQAVAPVANALVGYRNAIVGFDPSDPAVANNKENGITMVAVNSRGQMAMLVSQDEMTPTQAARLLRTAGFNNAVLLDSGNSSQAVYSQNTQWDSNYHRLSPTDRRYAVGWAITER